MSDENGEPKPNTNTDTNKIKTENDLSVETQSVNPSEAAPPLGSSTESNYLRLRGLPYSATENDIQQFFMGLAIERIKIVTLHEGRPSGEAYIEFKSKEDTDQGLTFDRSEMNGRYIEVFPASLSESEFAFRKLPPPSQQPQQQNSSTYDSNEESYVVRLRGIPWSCQEEDVRHFFTGLEPVEIVIGGTGGPRSRPSGEAFVRFASDDDAQKSLEFNHKHMGSRYVEVFPSGIIEMNREKGIVVPSSYERTGIRPLMSIDRADVKTYDQPSYQNNRHHENYGYGNDNNYNYGQDTGYGSTGYGYEHSYGSYNHDTAEQYNEESLKVYMRGLPYDADAQAIEGFFSPLYVHSVKIGVNDTNRPSGDACVEFYSQEDMISGMSRNQMRMGRRYVELFYARDIPAPMRRLKWRDTCGSTTQIGPRADIGPQRVSAVAGNRYGRDQNTEYPSGRGGGQRDFPSKNPYASHYDRQREQHPHYDANRQSWGGWSTGHNPYR